MVLTCRPTSPLPSGVRFGECLSPPELAQVRCFADIEVRGSFPAGILESVYEK